MPLTPKGTKILSRMGKTYGKKKAKVVFYAMLNEGKLTGVEGARKKRKTKRKKK